MCDVFVFFYIILYFFSRYLSVDFYCYYFEVYIYIYIYIYIYYRQEVPGSVSVVADILLVLYIL